MIEPQEYVATTPKLKYHQPDFGSYPDFSKKKLRKLYKDCSKKYKREIRHDLVCACTETYWIYGKYGKFPRYLKAFRGNRFFSWLEKWQQDAEKHFKKYFGKNSHKWEKRICKKFLKDVKRAYKARRFEEDNSEFIMFIESDAVNQ